METDFVKLMTTKSDDGLEEYINNRQKYTSVAIYAAVDELKKRGRIFTDEEFDKIATDVKQQEKIRMQRIADSEAKRKWDKNLVEDSDAIELYSQKAISGFSIAFGLMFSSILMALNLNRTPSKRAIPLVIVFGIVFTVVQFYLLSLIPRNSGLTLATNFGGALILNSVFWKKFIGDETPYRKRKIWVPLIIGILISALFLSVMILLPAA